MKSTTFLLLHFLVLCIGYIHLAASIQAKESMMLDQVLTFKLETGNFVLRNPFLRSFSISNELRFSLSHTGYNLTLKQLNSRNQADQLYHVSSRSSSSQMNITAQSSFKLFRSRSEFSNRILEYTLVWRGLTSCTPGQSICFYLGSNETYWQSTFLDRSLNSPKVASLNYQKGFTPFDKKNTFISSTTRPTLELLFLSQAGFAIMLDDLSPLALEHRVVDGNPLLCASYSPDNQLNVVEHPEEFTRIKLRILMAENICEAYSAAVQLYFPARSQQQLQATSLVYPYWSTDLLQYKAIYGPQLGRGGAAINAESSFIDALHENGFDHAHLIYENQSPLLSQYNSTLILNSLLIEMDKFNGNGQVLIQTETLTSGNFNFPATGLTILDEMLFNHNRSFKDNHDYIVELSAEAKFAFLQSSLGGLALQNRCPEPDDCFQQLFSNQPEELYGKYPNFLPAYFAEKTLKTQQEFEQQNFTFTMKYWNSPSTKVPLRLKPLIFATDVVYKMQSIPVLVQLTATDAEFDSKALQRILVEAQITSLAGYPFMQPRLYRVPSTELSELPSFNWYIRWIQAVTFLPSMFIPAPPWYYKENSSSDLVKKFIKIHQTEAMPRILALYKAWLETGEPIIRPLWYAEPEDSLCFQDFDCDSQFMLGSDLVVAPVIDLGLPSRDVYLPKGCWNAGWINNGTQQYPGHQIHTKIPTPLETLLWFVRC